MLLGTVNHAIVLGRPRLFIQLQLRFDELGRICDADFNAAGNATGEDVFPRVFRLNFELDLVSIFLKLLFALPLV